MNLVRSVLAPTLVIATSLVLALGATACKKDKPEGTNPPDGGSGGTVASSGGEGGSSAEGGAGEGGSAEGGGEPAGEKPKACDAETADRPTTLFGETVFIRPPINVALVEDNPTMAVAQVSGGFVSACKATVDRMNLMVFQAEKKGEKKKSPKEWADEFIDVYLAKGGYQGGTKSTPIVDTQTDFDISVEYPAAGGQPASVLYIAVRRRFENIFAIVYQTRPDEFPVLKPTFTASAGTLLVKPPG